MDAGFIGLGAMGSPMAGNLAAAGHRVVGWNRSEIDAPDGVELVGSPREVAAGTEVTFVVVTDGPAVEEVLFGDDGWASGATPGSVVIQSSTVGPSAARRISERLGEAGMSMLDAPVGGSVQPAVEGRLVVIGGGDAALFERFRPLFEAVAVRTVVMGGVGAGSAAKLAVNAVMLSTLAAASESVSWLAATEPEVDLEVFSSVLERISPVAARRVGAIAGEPPLGGFSMRQASKDMELVNEEFGRTDVMAAVREMTRAALELGLADHDTASLGTVARSRRRPG